MSRSAAAGDETARSDRRERRTRSALLDAFIRLVRRQRYDEIQVSEIAAAADVGRSTFYAHYQDKDELLFDSMSWFFDTLADTLRGDFDVGKSVALAAHVWENRALGRRVMVGPRAPFGTPRGVRRLAEAVERRMVEEGAALKLPARMVAIQIAEAQLGLLRSWFMGAAEATPQEIGAALRDSARGLLAAARA